MTLPSNLDPFSSSGIGFRVIEDDSASLHSIRYDNIPSIVLRTGSELDFADRKWLQRLEVEGRIITLRKPDQLSLSEALGCLIDNRTRHLVSEKLTYRPKSTNFHSNWLGDLHSSFFSN